MVVPCEPFVPSQHGTLLVYDLTFSAFYFHSNGSRFSQLMLRLYFILFFYHVTFHSFYHMNFHFLFVSSFLNSMSLLTVMIMAGKTDLNNEA